MNLTFLIFTFLAIASTTLGGFLALRFARHLRPLIGFAAGMLIAVAFFDLLPESFQILRDFQLLSLGVLAGFLFYLTLERFILFHACQEPTDSAHRHAHASGSLGLFGLTLHRAMDGLVIGLSFQGSTALGVLVSLAIVAHSFPDGVNAVAVMLSKKKLQFNRWIFMLAVAILAGALIAQFVVVPEKMLGFLIAFVGGWFLYLGASDLLPEAHRESANLLPLATTILGIVLVWVLTAALPHI